MLTSIHPRTILTAAIVLLMVQSSQAAEEAVAAKVNGESVYAADVRREVQRATLRQKVAPLARKTLEAETLEQFVNRQLVIGYLNERKLAANTAEVNLAIKRLKKELDKRELPFDEYLEKQQLSEAGLKRRLFWQLSWKNYLDRYVTDENLEKYFKSHAADFDGRRVKVAHLLLKTKTDKSAVDEQIKRTKQLRRQIVDGTVSFTEAAKQHSQSPTAKSGGGLGFIKRHEPMPEPFSAAAFALGQGEVSEPVVTAFGVHLIQCQEIEAGKNKWSDVREPLTKSVTKYLFHWIADRERPNAQIEFTGALPYFAPGKPKRLVDAPAKQ